MRHRSWFAKAPSSAISTRTEKAAREVLEGRSRRGFFRRVLPFLGPAFIASIAYIDPGNFATNIQSGAQYGYLLLWVVLGSNVMASVIQVLAAKLGIASRKNLAEHCADQFSKPFTFGLWIAMEVGAMASDLTGFIGAVSRVQPSFRNTSLDGGASDWSCHFHNTRFGALMDFVPLRRRSPPSLGLSQSATSLSWF